MKRFFCLILLVSVYFLNAFEHKLDILETSHIDSVLSVINMNRTDLTFNLNLSERDIFRLNVVDSLFDKPMSTFNVTDEISEYIAENQTELSKIILFSSEFLDITARTPDYSGNEQMKTNLNIHSENMKIINNLFKVMPTINQLIESAFSELNAEEKEFLSEYGKSMLIGEDEEQEQEEEQEELSLKERRDQIEESNRMIKKFGKIAAKVKLSEIIEASVLLFGFTEETIEIISQIEKEAVNDKLSYESPWGKIQINPEANVVDENTLFVLDYYGDDLWLFNDSHRISLIIDVCGNDIYRGENYCQGAAYMGLSGLFDLAGDDVYLANNYAQGVAMFGVGVLQDYVGDDKYYSKGFVQGGSAFGLGLLLDGKGDDTYQCNIYGQGFGYIKGLGCLSDKEGNDDYVVKKDVVDMLRYDDHYESLSQGFGFGRRPYFSGGIGILSDYSGNDSYISDIYGQGSAYWYAIGGLVDHSGNDRYNSYQYAQGSGVHLAFGVLTDYSGKDNYVSNGVSQGCGHDYAFGGLLDYSGDDNYVCYDLSQGGGNANAISFFLDVNGDDGYIAKKGNVHGYSDWRRDFGYIGLFLDLNGNDFYSVEGSGNDKVWSKSTYGAGLDSKNEYLDEVAAKKQHDAEPVDIHLGEDMETLFLQASAAPQSYQHIVQPAREKLIEMGEDVVPYLLNYLESDHVRETHALIEIIPKIGSPALPHLESVLSDSVDARVSFSIYLMGRIKEKTVFDTISYFCKEDSRFLSGALGALVYLEDERAVDIFNKFIQHKTAIIRRISAIGLQKINNSSSVSHLLRATDDDYQEVRFSAQIALSKIVPSPWKEVQEYFYDASLKSQRHIIGYMKTDKNKQNRKFLKKICKQFSGELIAEDAMKALEEYD
ncbi:MAG: hypothetical protein PHR06_02790 [Candidatus Cloacimonetes bacterium]|nr:hypothetical protein [Candidatus Cloacimonadota bacterium]